MSVEKKFQENVEKRALVAESVFFASFIAGLNSFGILNQAVVNLASRRSGKHLAHFAELANFSDADRATGANWSALKKFEKAIEILKRVMPISKDIETKEKNGEILVSIRNSTCKFCPKGVGEAELQGTLCPFPSLLESFSNELWESEDIQLIKERAKPIMKKDGDWCIFRYRAKKDSE
ncbi:MAG: hypothetical protein K8S62_13955 [Candidatus Sabulitectum sp.]|nr:hypothetical protein [Candidatus Sabulitectum sp.]